MDWEKIIDEQSIITRTNVGTVIDHLKSEWNIDKEIIIRVVLVLSGSYDESSSYLNDMEGFGYREPGDYWGEYCEYNRIEHEANNNPFINLYPITK